MGILQNGKQVERWYNTKNAKGHFVRTFSQFRNQVTPDGAPGPSGIGGFKAEAGCYDLYFSLACPWAQRTLIFEALKGLENMITISLVNYYMAEKGWTFAVGHDVIPYNVNQKEYIYQIYTTADPENSGRATV